MPLLNLRLVRPSLLVDLNRIEGLDADRGRREPLRVGALVRQSALAAQLVAERARCSRECAPAHRPLRRPGTAARSAARSRTPTRGAELPVALATLGGRGRRRVARGRRELAADDFFVTHFTTALEPGRARGRHASGRPPRALGLRVRGARAAPRRLRARDGGVRASRRGRQRGARRGSCLGAVTDAADARRAPRSPAAPVDAEAARAAAEAARASVEPDGTMHALARVPAPRHGRPGRARRPARLAERDDGGRVIEVDRHRQRPPAPRASWSRGCCSPTSSGTRSA